MTAPQPRAVLVAVASRHGGTMGVAGSVAEGLREALGDGASVELHPVEDVERVGGHDAVVEEMATLTRWLEHRVFPGRLDRSELGFAARAMVAALHAPEGDFRDPAAARAWGREIAAALVAPERTGG